MVEDLVVNLSAGQREIAYLFNPDLGERCHFFPPQTPDNSRAVRPCGVVDKECHFSEQMHYERCPIYQAYQKGKSNVQKMHNAQIPSHS